MRKTIDITMMDGQVIKAPLCLVWCDINDTHTELYFVWKTPYGWMLVS